VSDGGSSPTFGRPGGEHRVLEPAGGEPLTATRLDALADLWDGELRLDLEVVVLDGAAHRAWVDRLAPDPDVLAGAIAETVAERGGLGTEAEDATLVGRVATIAAGHPHPVAVGERVAVTAPAIALPLFGAPTRGWDGGPAIPMRGHAIVPSAVPTIPVGDAEPELAAVLASVADVPAQLAPGGRVVVLGVDTPAGAVAVAALAAQQRHVTAVGASLGSSRLARALGATAATVADLGDPLGTEALVREVAGDTGPAARLDLVVLATPAAAALAARLAPVVQVVSDLRTDPTVVARVIRHARAVGRGVAVHAGRGAVADRGTALRDLVASGDVLLRALRWHAGVGSLPGVGRDPEDP
jgi:hypothetical protein